MIDQDPRLIDSLLGERDKHRKALQRVLVMLRKADQRDNVALDVAMTARGHGCSTPSSPGSFLAGLAQLPLIGGSVTLLGQPSAVAATRQILEAYKAWLHLEHRVLSHEIAELPEMVAYYGGTSSERHDFPGPNTWLALAIATSRTTI